MRDSALYTYGIDLLHYWVANRPDNLQIIAMAHCESVPMSHHRYNSSWFVAYVDPSKPEDLSLTSDYIVDWSRLTTSHCWQLVDEGVFVPEVSDNEYEIREYIAMKRRRKYSIIEEKLYDRYDRAIEKRKIFEKK